MDTTCIAVELWNQKAKSQLKQTLPKPHESSSQNSLYEVYFVTSFESIYSQILTAANTEAKIQHTSLKHHTNTVFSVLQKYTFVWEKISIMPGMHQIY